MNLVIGADHGGYRMKGKLIAALKKKGHLVADLGTHSSQSCDYPPIGYKVAISVSEGNFPLGILICKTGIGFSIVANKIPGIRAALCLSPLQARRSREHNDANLLVLSANYLTLQQAVRIVQVWLKTGFDGGRHARRVRQIADIERKVIINSK